MPKPKRRSTRPIELTMRLKWLLEWGYFSEGRPFRTIESAKRKASQMRRRGCYEAQVYTAAGFGLPVEHSVMIRPKGLGRILREARATAGL